MNGAADLVRQEVRELEPYELDLSPVAHKLDQNEAPWEPPAWFKRRVAEKLLLTAWRHYPDFHGDRLRARLAAVHEWPAAGILVGNGSNELLQVALLALAGAGRRVLGLLPTFGLYRGMARFTGADWVTLGPRPDLRLPLDELECRLAEDPPEILLLCSPNNPTGEVIPVSRIEAWLERFDGIVLLDQAYVEFSTQDARRLLERTARLVLFRTFSKAWSLASFRLGYMLAAPELVEQLRKVKLPYNLGRPAQIAGEILLESGARQQLARKVRRLVSQRSAWEDTLREGGAEVFPGEANFVLARWQPERFERVKAALSRCRIRVRDVSLGPGLAGCLRVSLGDLKDLRTLRRALRREPVEPPAGKERT